jgi:hypothetical protein
MSIQTPSAPVQLSPQVTSAIAAAIEALQSAIAPPPAAEPPAEPEPEPPRLLRLGEVSAKLNISIPTIRRMLRDPNSGLVPVMLSKCLRVTSLSVDELLRRGA